MSHLSMRSGTRVAGVIVRREVKAIFTREIIGDSWNISSTFTLIGSMVLIDSVSRYVYLPCSVTEVISVRATNDVVYAFSKVYGTEIERRLPAEMFDKENL